LNSVIRMYQNLIFLFFILLGLSCHSGSQVSPSDLPPIDQTKEETTVNPEALQHFMDGQLYMNQGNYSMAVTEFQEALRFDPDVSTIHISLGECFWALEKPDRAVFHLERAIHLNPDDTEARNVLAHQFINRQMFDRAKEQYEILAESDPENVENIIVLAELAKLQHQFEEAIHYYQKAFDLDPQRIESLKKAAEIALKIKRFDLAQFIIKRMTLEDKSNIQYLENYADIAIMNGDKKEGIKALKQIADLEGPSAGVLNQIGLLYYEINHPDSALKVFSQVYELDSLNILALHLLSQINREEEHIEKAQYFADQMIYFHPSEPRGYINASLALLIQNNHERVIQILSKQADIFLEEFTIQYLLGLSYNLDNNHKLAEQFFKRALAINPKSRNVLHSLAIIYDKTNQVSQSDSIYNELIHSDSTDAQALNNYSYSLVERGEKLDIALAMSKKAISLSPKSSAYLDTYGWIHFKIGNIDSALAYIRKSVEIEDTNAVVLEHFGDVLIKNAEIEEAIHYFRKALEIDPNNAVLRKKLSEL